MGINPHPSIEPQVAEVLFVQAEVVANLVEDGLADLVDHLSRGATHALEVATV
jgi:hypothetical protein